MVKSEIQNVKLRFGIIGNCEGLNRANDVAELNSLFGGIFFIGIFLSLILMDGTVIVIYNKQISEG